MSDYTHSTPISSLPSSQSGAPPMLAPPIQVGKQPTEHPKHVYEDIRTHAHPFLGNIDHAAVADTLRSIPTSALQQPHSYPHQQPPYQSSTHASLSTQSHQLDPSIQAGYIPPPHPGSVSDEFIHNHNMATNRELRKYQTDRYRNARTNELIDMVQLPLLLAILFFIFNSTTVNKMFFQMLSPYNLYDEIGNMNSGGLGIKSILFGMLYYAVNWSIDYVSFVN